MEEKINESEKKGRFGKSLRYLIMAQTFVVVIFITGLLAVKMFFPCLFSELKEKYKESFMTETSKMLVLDGEDKKK